MTRSVGKNYIWLSSYQLLVAATPLVTAPYLARVLGATALGQYALIASAGSVASTVSLLGTYNYGNRMTAYVRDDMRKLRRLVEDVMVLRLGFGLLGCAGYFAWGVASGIPLELLSVYLLWLLGMMFDVSWLFVGLEDMRPAVWKNGAARLASVLGVFVFVRSSTDLVNYLAISGIAVLLANLSVYARLARVIPRRTSSVLYDTPSGWDEWTSRHGLSRWLRSFMHLRGSVVLLFPQVPGLLSTYFGRFFLAARHPPAELGYFDQADKLVGIPVAVIASLSTVAMPRVAHLHSRGAASGIRELLLRSLRVTSLVTIPSAIVLAVVGPQIVYWFLGPLFGASGSVVRVLAPLLFFTPLALIASLEYFTAVDQVRVVVVVGVVSAAINVSVCFALIPALGAVGFSVASLLAGGFNSVILTLIMFRRLRIWGALRYLTGYLFASSVMGAVIYFTGFMLPAEPIFVGLRVTLGGVVYFLLLLVLRDKGLRQAVGYFRSLIGAD